MVSSQVTFSMQPLWRRRVDWILKMRVVGICGWSGAGKTILIRRLIAYFADLGLKVSTIKHVHDSFDIDQSGKDSYLHRAAGARDVLIASDTRWALLHECGTEPPPQIEHLVRRMYGVDLVLVEGFRESQIRNARCTGSHLASRSAPSTIHRICDRLKRFRRHGAAEGHLARRYRIDQFGDPHSRDAGLGSSAGSCRMTRGGCDVQREG
jgi:molybdopterin-guanine dinucleotide biosynthesis protein MobB